MMTQIKSIFILIAIKDSQFAFTVWSGAVIRLHDEVASHNFHGI